MRNVSEDLLKEICDFFSFTYLEELKKFMSENQDWEENVSKHIESIIN